MSLVVVGPVSRPVADPRSEVPAANPAPARPQPSLADAPAALKSVASEVVQRDSYEIQFLDEPSGRVGYRAFNPSHRMEAKFFEDHLTIAPKTGSPNTPPPWDFGLSLQGYGYGKNLIQPPRASLSRTGNRVTYQRGDVKEWYVNDSKGLEQGFTFANPPQSSRADQPQSGPLIVSMKVSGDLVPTLHGQTVQLRRRGQSRPDLLYSDLYAYDADGTKLPAKIGLSGKSINLNIDDKQAKYPLTIDPVVHRPQAKLTANDAGTKMKLGTSVSISGNTAVVGAADNASAYVFERSGETWTLQQKLRGGNANFGWSVAVSGDTVMVGADYQSTGWFDEGLVYVFERSGALWELKQTLEPSLNVERSGDRFGFSVAIDGDSAIISSLRGPGLWGDGTAYAFVRGADGLWVEQQELRVADAGLSWNGYSVSISGDTAVVSSLYASSAATNQWGAIFIFAREGPIWVQQASFRPPSSPYISSFGHDVAVSGDTVVVGAPGDDLEDPNTDAGAVYVYTRSNGLWSQQQKLIASDPQPDLHFGTSVGISGDVLVAGAEGYDDPAGVNAGAAYVFTRSDNEWTQQTKFVASDASANDLLGTAVAISGDTAVVTVPQDDLGALVDAGSAFVLVPGEAPVETPEFSIRLDPANSTGPADSHFTITARVTDRAGSPANGKKVPFSVDGDNAASGVETSNSSGEAAFSYKGEVAGDDTITAFVDANQDGVRQVLEPEAMATRSWTATQIDPPAPPPVPGKVRFWGECWEGCPNKPTTPAGLTNMVAVSAGSEHWLALDKDGGVWAWGANDGGQLGDGTVSYERRADPMQVKDDKGGVFRAQSISAGYGYSLALGTDGALWGWGHNSGGQLGNGTLSNSPLPVRVVNPDDVTKPWTNVKSFSAGAAHSIAISDDGTAWSWGCNSEGQLGRGASGTVSVPLGYNQCAGQPFPGKVLQEDDQPLNDVAAVAAGGDFSLALISDGTVRSWGGNGYGQLGDGTRTARPRSTQVVDSRPGAPNRPLQGVKTISAGQYVSVVVKTNGTIWGWGESYWGQLGRDPEGGFSIPRPSRIPGLPKMAAVAAGYLHVIASDTKGAVWAWGRTQDGKGSYSQEHFTPFRVANIGGPVTALSAKTFTSLVLASPPTGPPEMSFRPESMSFPEQKVKAPSGAKTLGITNVGIDPLRIDSIRKSGPNAADFSVEGDGCTGKALPANRSCSVGLIFTPQAEGSRAAELEVVNNAAGSPHSISLSGTGTRQIDETLPSEPLAGGWWGDLDPSLNPCKAQAMKVCDGKVLTDVGPPLEGQRWAALSDTAVQRDGRIVAAGYGGGSHMVLRFKTDGSLDETFGEGGIVRVPQSISALALGSDEKIVIGGGGGLMRLLQDGRPDNSFGEAGVVRTSLGANDLAVQPDGKIVIGGSINGPPRQRLAWTCPGEDPLHCRSSSLRFMVARFNSNGEPDKSFGSNGIAEAEVGSGDYAQGWALALQPDGRIILGGSAARIGDINAIQCISMAYWTVTWPFFFIPLYCRDVKVDFALARFEPDGKIDGTFGQGGWTSTAFGQDYSGILAVTVQGDGKIVAAGCAKGAGCSWGSSEGGFGLARYDANGKLDEAGFGNKGKVVTNFAEGAALPTDIVVAPDGDLIAAGRAGKNLAVARYSPQGYLEEDFDEDGKATTPPPCSMNPRHNRCFVTHEDLADSGALAAIAIQPQDGKVVGVGSLMDDGDPSFSRRGGNLLLVRYETGGKLDQQFGNDGLVLKQFDQDTFDSSIPEETALQPDGKIVVAGRANERSNYYQSDPALVRYNRNGTLDKSFGDNGRVITTVQTFFPSYSLGEGGGFDDFVVQPDGKIVAVGHVEKWQDQTRIIVARYNPDGSLDSEFNPCESGETACRGVLAVQGGKAETVNGFASVGMQPQADGTQRIVVAAKAFQHHGTVPYPTIDVRTTGLAVLRYHLDGTLDKSFGDGGVAINFLGAEAAAEVDDLVVQSDRKIVVSSARSLARFEPDGNPDTSFNHSGRVTTGIAGYGIALQPLEEDGKKVEKILLAGGVPYAASGQFEYAFAVARYNADGSPDDEFGGSSCPPPNQTCRGGTVITRIRGNDSATSVALQPDGKIVAAGTSSLVLAMSYPPRVSTDLALARYRPNGELDSCALPGTVTTPVEGYTYGKDVTVQPDGRIVAAIQSGYPWKFGLVRFKGGQSDPAREVSISPTATVPEPDSGAVAAPFTASLTTPACENLEIEYTTKNGTAEVGKDFEAGAGRISIPKGKRDALLTVPILSDTTPEPDEDFFVDISSKAAKVIQPRGKATILDAQPGLSIGDARVVEGNDGKVRAVFNLALNDGGHKTVSAGYSTVEGTAKSGTDYQPKQGTVTFKPGETHKTIIVEVIGDTIDEQEESFFVDLENAANTTLSRARGTGGIVDDDTSPESPKQDPDRRAGLPPFVPGPTRGGDSAAGGFSPGSLPPPSTVSTGQAQIESVVQGQAQSQAQVQSQINLQANTQASAQTAAQLQAQPVQAADLQSQLSGLAQREREREFNVEIEGAGGAKARSASSYLASAREQTIPVAATGVAWAGSVFALAAGLFYRRRTSSRETQRHIRFAKDEDTESR